MERLKRYRIWFGIVAVCLLAVACSPFGDESPASSETPVATPTSTPVVTATATTILAEPSPTATVPPSPTATREPYPGVTMPFPVDDCDVTPMTGWRIVNAAWVEGVGIDVGVPDGLLYEGENSLLWRGDGETIHVSAALADGSQSESSTTEVVVVPDGNGQVVETWLTFDAPGCWRIRAEQGGNHVDATFAVFPEACLPETFDLNRCATPPYALHWNPEVSAPAGCDLPSVVGVITGFIDAINRADVDAALRFFPERDQETDIDTTGLRWFSLEKMVANKPDELRPLLSELIDGGEQLRLVRLDLGWGWDGGAQFGVYMTRETDELLRYRIEGKGAVNCELEQLYVVSVARQP